MVGLAGNFRHTEERFFHFEAVRRSGLSPPAGLTGDRFVAIDDLASRSAPQQLDSLVQSLNRLRIPTADIIDIIRELYRSGKLHAVYDEH